MQIKSEELNKNISELMLKQDITVLEEIFSADGILNIKINSNDILKTFDILKNTLDYNLLIFICGTDLNDSLELCYQLFSIKNSNFINIKTCIERENPLVESISSIYKSAEWHERETYDLLGVIFNNHPELNRLLLPQDWIGHPLRKDYEMKDTRLSWNNR